MGMPSILALFILVAIATASGVNALAEGHPGAYEPKRTNRSDNGLGYYLDSDAGMRSSALSKSENRRLRSGNYYNQRILPKESKHVSLHAENPEDADGDLVQRHVTLVIAVPSVRPDRRKAIRETWMKLADDRVVLRFFTEPPNRAADSESAKHAAMLLEEELQTHGDIVILDIDPGMNFGLKLLWAMRWMSYHYSFDFFLRLDDDYFLCLERLVEELDCLRIPGKQQSPIFAGYRVCDYHNHAAAYAEEAYILFSSSIIDRVLAVSGFICSGYGSLTAASWIRIGGPGNPDGDVAFVHDYRLDHPGDWWKNTKIAKYSPLCERGLGIHHTYPERMYKLWMEVSGRTNATQSTGGCTSLFRYEDDGECPFVSRVVDGAHLEEDNFQPCDTFTAEGESMEDRGY